MNVTEFTVEMWRKLFHQTNGDIQMVQDTELVFTFEGIDATETRRVTIVVCNHN